MIKKLTALATLTIIFYLHGLSQAFNPLNYQPPVEKWEPDGDKGGLQLYVSPTGKDDWMGRTSTPSGKEGPFQTIERAKEEARKIIKSKKIPEGGITINIMKGYYTINKSLSFDENDGGEENKPVIYRAYKNEEVHILGGRKINSSDFVAVTDRSVLKIIDPSAKGKLLQLDTRKLNLTHTASFPDVFSDGGGIFELFVNDKRMNISRWPDDSNATMKEVVTNGDKTQPGSFIYRSDRPARWNPDNNVWLKGFWRVGWENPAIKVAKIDTAKHQIDFKVGIQAGIGNKYTRPKGNGKEEWYAINLVEEITKPGEWCINFNTGMLYLWPPENFKDAEIVVSQLDQPVFQSKGLGNTAFVGLTIEGALGDGMRFEQSNHNVVAGCVFKNLGGVGVWMDGMKSGVLSCDMFGLGKGCVIISGGDREKLKESGNYVINNHFHDYAVLRSQYSAAVDLYSDNKGLPAVGILIAHNLIHHAPRDGVLYSGNKNVFEYNEIHRCGYSTADVGAFYSWMDWTARGIVIRYNYIHHTVGGVNPDDGSSGTFVYGNIFAGNRIGVWIASGPDHTIQNNIFIKNNEESVFGIDDRGRNRGYATNKNLLAKVNSIHPKEAPWSTTFPEMATLLESHPELPLRTKFIGNLICMKNGVPTKLKMSKENNADTNLIKIENNLVVYQDPGFVDSAIGNYNLKKSSPVFKKIPGFPKIEQEKMGLYIDKFRKKLPTPEEAGRLPQQDPWKDGDKDLNFGT